MKKYLLILAFITAIAFSRVVASDLLNWDDPAHITNNKFVTEFTWSDPLHMFFEKDTANHTYIPLTVFNFAILYKLFAKNAMVFHLSSLLTHILVVWMVFLVAMRFGLTSMGAMAAALLFALHPARVENVAWATAQKDLMYSLFYLISIYFYLGYLEGKNKVQFFVLALVAGFLSILAKPMALSLPWILWVVDWMRGRKISIASIVDKIPFFLVIEPIAWITYSQNSREINFDFMTGIMTWLWSASFYIKRFFWPFNLSPIYSMPEPVAITNAAYIVSWLILVATGVGLWFYRKNRWVIFAFIYFVLSIFFVWRLDARDISFVADRFLYLPALAACLAVGRLWEFQYAKLNASKRKLFMNASFAAVVILAGLCFYNLGMWKNGLTLWNNVINRSPEIAFGYNNRGMIYLGEGKNDEALADFEKALEVAKKGRIYQDDGKILISAGRAQHYAKAYYNMGILQAKQKKYEEALKYFNLAIYYDMGQAEYFNNRGATLIKLGHQNEAMGDYNAALVIDKENYEARLNRGLLNYKMSNKEEALKEFEMLTKSFSKQAEPFLQAGRIYYEKGDIDTALGLFLSASKAEPENAQAWYNLGVLYAKKGDKDKARDSFSQAQLKWIADPEKYPLPGLKPEDAKVWEQRLKKNVSSK